MKLSCTDCPLLALFVYNYDVNVIIYYCVLNRIFVQAHERQSVGNLTQIKFTLWISIDAIISGS